MSLNLSTPARFFRSVGVGAMTALTPARAWERSSVGVASHQLPTPLEDLGTETDTAEWIERFDQLDLHYASRTEIQSMHASAPDPFMRGLLNSVMLFRIELASLTGCEFKAALPNGVPCGQGSCLETAEGNTSGSPSHWVRGDPDAQVKEALSQRYPQWHADFELTDPHWADRSELAGLLASAPHPFLRGMLTGAMLFRIELSNLTGRAFC